MKVLGGAIGLILGLAPFLAGCLAPGGLPVAAPVGQGAGNLLPSIDSPAWTPGEPGQERGPSSLHGAQALKVTGPGRGGAFWQVRPHGLAPGRTYTLRLRVSRDRQTNGQYPSVDFLGRRVLLDEVWRADRVYPVELVVTHPDGRVDQELRLVNDFAMTATFSHLELEEGAPAREPCDPPLRPPRGFRLGVYGAPPQAYPRLAAAGIDLVVMEGWQLGEGAASVPLARRAGLDRLIVVPADPAAWERLVADLERQGFAPGPGDGFYVADEPELKPEPPAVVAKRRRRALALFPGAYATVALLRPRLARDYACAGDVFITTPYPIPNQPLTWVSKTLDQVRDMAGRGRVWAAVQAFGGGQRWTAMGWPRMPSRREMLALGGLSLVHGARGLIFFTYRDVEHSPAWDDFCAVLDRLGDLRSWLDAGKGPESLVVEPLGHRRADAVGGSAVHAARWRGERSDLILAVNTLDHHVRALVECPGEEAKALWGGERRLCRGRRILLAMGPHEVWAGRVGRD